MAKHRVSHRKGGSTGIMNYAVGGAIYGVARAQLSSVVMKF